MVRGEGHFRRELRASYHRVSWLSLSKLVLPVRKNSN
jgi:hypothetical protein